MKFLGLILGLFMPFSMAFAQSVLKSENGQAVVGTREIKLKMGDQVTFFDGSLSEAGQGTVTKVTPNGSQALVKVTKGHAQTGMSFEKAELQNSHEPEKGDRRMIESGRLKYAELSEEDRAILSRGEISDTRYIVGGILATYPIGLGVGHAVQGRYSEKGWIFTVGELGSIAVMFAGIGNCVDRWSYSNSSCSSGLVLLGAFSYLGFRVWEAIDAWAVPPQQNRRYWELRRRMGENPVTFSPVILPRPDGASLGLQVSF